LVNKRDGFYQTVREIEVYFVVGNLLCFFRYRHQTLFFEKKWNLISLCFLSLSTNAATNFIDWDHFYLGINLGPMFENSILSAYQNSIVSQPYYNQTLHRGTFFIGGQVGKLYRYNRFLLTGFEVDVDSLNISQNYTNSEEPQSWCSRWHRYRLSLDRTN
jgi:hypothetical protein